MKKNYCDQFNKVSQMLKIHRKTLLDAEIGST